ncbi:DUF2026 family protein [Neorhizobium sp. NCHU2750]|uniref:DUF2026 family protein n=1 Tax=Neorhizobium sp. NCHU2750 TaxID=1825976 RepID=UPI000E75C9BF|nr:hypothetical protein NCHU2750_47850 [Neorhizobium sp. NCHU2750]
MLIKQSDYHRIYRVINSLLVAANADPATASMYFSTFGAFILKQHYKLDAAPKGGLAAYRLGDTTILFADHREDGYVTGTGENFHCWVEAEGWMIDFMAPALPQAAGNIALPSRMLQKPMSGMASSINHLDKSGDFFCKHEQEAMARNFSDWQKHAMIGDMASVAAKWFRKSPKQMPSSISIEEGDGNARTVPLIGNTLSGSW